MLTFVSGWRTPERDKVIVEHRDVNRSAIYFIDDTSTLPILIPDIPIVEVWRNGRLDFELPEQYTHVVRMNYDTDNEMIMRSVGRVLMQGSEAQLIVMFDASDKLHRFFPELRHGNALLAADARLNAAEGDRVIFTRGGSFTWKDHLLESRTAALIGDETLDVGIVDAELTALDV